MTQKPVVVLESWKLIVVLLVAWTLLGVVLTYWASGG